MPLGVQAVYYCQHWCAVKRGYQALRSPVHFKTIQTHGPVFIDVLTIHIKTSTTEQRLANSGDKTDVSRKMLFHELGSLILASEVMNRFNDS